MAYVIAVGPDVALLEGVAQTLISAGHNVLVAEDIAEAVEALRGSKPLVALVACGELIGNEGHRLRLADGGALLAFDCDDEDTVPLPFSVKRGILARLRLPLERQRLLALVRYVESRARAAGREIREEDSPVSRTQR